MLVSRPALTEGRRRAVLQGLLMRETKEGAPAKPPYFFLKSSCGADWGGRAEGKGQQQSHQSLTSLAPESMQQPPLPDYGTQTPFG